MKQYEAVIAVMEQNGGFATLGCLYEKVLKVPDVCWKTKTPFATIRRIVQDKRYFFKIKPGLWALNSYKNRLPSEISLLLKEDSGSKKGGEFSHSYYQGLIIEIGKIKGFKTYIPSQDKKKRFLDRPLGEMADLDGILPFTYKDILKRVQSIDVFWFNERRFPSYIFEVEHTTDFKGALLKFLELQDFSVCMFVVSSERRQKEFISRLDFEAFKPIRSKTRFISYEQVSQWHAKIHELSLKERGIL